MIVILPIWAVLQGLFLLAWKARLMDHRLLKWWVLLSPTLLAVAAVPAFTGLIDLSEYLPTVLRFLAISQGVILLVWIAFTTAARSRRRG